MPKVENIEEAVAKILAPFNENGQDEDGNPSTNTFFDWYQIGGRWTGCHDDYDPSKDERNIKTCWLCEGTGLRNDELGHEARKKDPAYKCNGCDGTGKMLEWPTQWVGYEGDVMPLSSIKDDLIASRVIIATPSYPDYTNDNLEPEFMIENQFWNGVSWVDSNWDGKVKTALGMYLERVKMYSEEFQKVATPTDEWVVVTIDYHN